MLLVFHAYARVIFRAYFLIGDVDPGNISDWPHWSCLEQADEQS